MSEMPKAELFYLTEPSRGVFIANARVGLGDFRFEISRDQLANFLIDGAAMALRADDKINSKVCYEVNIFEIAEEKG